MKKDFKAINPAMQFISRPAELEAQAAAEEAAPARSSTAEVEDDQGEMELKSRRLQLLIRPSIHAALKAEAKQKRTSVNDLINTILQAHVEED